MVSLHIQGEGGGAPGTLVPAVTPQTVIPIIEYRTSSCKARKAVVFCDIGG